MAGSLRKDTEQLTVDRLQARIDAMQSDLRKSRATTAAVERENETLRAMADVSARALNVPRWVTAKTAKAGHVGTVCTMLSDNHLDEVVNPDEMSGQNAYDRNIAEQRLERIFYGIDKITAHYWKGVTYDGCVCFLGGDTLSGIIHEELDRTNDGEGPLEAVFFWAEKIAAGIAFLADTFGHVHCPCVVGNHGRLDQKPQAKSYVKRNFDWQLYRALAMHFKGDDRVTFVITDDIDLPVQVHNTSYLLTHGIANGGGGIGGIFPPLRRLRSQLVERWGSFDVMIVGHWHQYIPAFDWGMLVNGASKGPDEWTRKMRFRPERPSQALWLTTPENGVTMSAPVLVRDKKAEGW